MPAMTWGKWRASVLLGLVLLVTWPIEYSGAMVDGTCGLTFVRAFEGDDGCTLKARGRLVAAAVVLLAASAAESYGRKVDDAQRPPVAGQG